MLAKKRFKASYSEVRRAITETRERAHNLPCGADDALFEQLEGWIQSQNEAVQIVLNTRWNRDFLVVQNENRYWNLRQFKAEKGGSK